MFPGYNNRSFPGRELGRYGGGFKYFQSITINNTSTNQLNDYPVRLDLSVSNFDFTKVKLDGSDIRFYEGATMLSHYTESFNTIAKTALIWVKIPSLQPSASKVITIKYGNASAKNVSNGNNVFDLFDDFSGDTAKFYAENAPTFSLGHSTYNYMCENIEFDPVTNKYWWIFEDRTLSPYTISLASSDAIDGAWTVTHPNVISPNFVGGTVAPALFRDDDGMWYIYYGTAAGIAVQRSSSVSSGYSASGINNPIVPKGAAGTWNAVRSVEPFMFKDGNIYRLLYMGESTGDLLEKTGMATSNSPISGFVDSPLNPILGTKSDWNAGQDVAADPYCIKIEDTYYIFVSASAVDKVNWRIGCFKTKDWVTFTEVDDNNPVMYLGQSGAWDASQVIRGGIIKVGEKYYMTYTGGGTVRKGGITELKIDSGKRISKNKWGMKRLTSAVNNGKSVIYSDTLTSLAKFGVNYSLRGKAIMPNSGGTSLFAFRNNLDAGSKYAAIYGSSNVSYQLRGGTYDTAGATSSAIASHSTDLVMEVIRNGSSSVIFKINDVVSATLNTQIPTDDLSIMLTPGVSSDFVAIRKYNNPEPLVTIIN